MVFLLGDIRGYITNQASFDAITNILDMEPVELLLIQSSVSVNFSTAASLQHLGVGDIITGVLSRISIPSMDIVWSAQQLVGLIFNKSCPQLIIVESSTNKGFDSFIRREIWAAVVVGTGW